MRITVVTPLFPTNAEPYRGWPLYRTVLELQCLATVQVVCPVMQVPSWLGLKPRSFRYSPIDPNYSPGGVQAVYRAYASIPVLSRPLNGYRCGRAIRDAVRESRPDVILAYWFYPEGFGALQVARQLGVPLVVGSRGSDMRLPDPISRRQAVYTMKNSDAVLTVSSELRDRALEFGIPAERVHTIRNGIDGTVFKPRRQDDVRPGLGISPRAKVICFVGWLNVTKGVRELIAAARQIAPRFEELRVVMIGQGPLMAEIQAINSEDPVMRGKIDLLGRRQSAEIAEWMAGSDLLCLPSYSEGCPNVVVEALSCGRPVVATNVGGIPELLDQSNGIMTPPRSVRALAEALETALRKEWATAAIAASRLRSWADVAEETFAVCGQVLAQCTARRE